MAVCKSCSAPLAANTNLCQYCGVRNDVDLQARQDYTVTSQLSDRLCPNCHTFLQTIDLKINGHFYIERCDTCFGLFFDPGEVEELLESSVAGVFSANLALIDTINQERYPLAHKVKYVKCPVCQVLMNRVNFGYRSGVVADQCKAHGIWLDSGEIIHLMEWKKAGGQLLDRQKQEQTAGVKSEIAYKEIMRAANQTQRKPRFEVEQKEEDKPLLLKILSGVVSVLFDD
jgi:Zn-finger nucleic acid-binding protein